MTFLRLRIDKYVEGDISPQVYAKIFSIHESSAQRTVGRTALQELIPVSSQPEDAKSIAVEPGRYYVETVLPSGEILADSVSVASGETQDLVLRAEDSPHEWLSWQHLVGNIQPNTPVELRRPAAPIRRRSKPRAGAAKSRRPTRSRGGHLSLGRPSQLGTKARHRSDGRVDGSWEAAAEVIPPREVNMKRPIQCLSHPHPPLVNHRYGHEVWWWLANASSTDPSTLVHTLNEGKRPMEIPASIKDEAHAVFRVSWSPSKEVVKPLSGCVIQSTRYFVVVTRRQSVELVSLPIPWQVVSTDREADIEIAVQEPSEPNGFCTAAIARDEQLGMLLGYLSSGSMPTARQMAETAKMMLYDKFKNPFAAAAGAYALVGTASHASERDWHDWVRNLMNNFQYIPDGAIQWGQLKLRMRRNLTDMEDAKTAFKLAYRRGLPFYSMGMRWLLDGLESVSRGDDEAQKMLENVRPLAWRTHYQQPFTILRLGGESSV